MSKIKWMGLLITVSDIEKSRIFYEKIMELELLSVTEGMVEFKNGITLYQDHDYVGIVAGDYALKPTGVKLEMKKKPNNFQLYFEVEDLDYWVAKIKSTDGIEIIHDVMEYEWGQHVFRFYDYDKHIVEVSESIDYVARRFLAQGLTVEEIAERFGDPVEYVQQHYLSNNNK